MEALFLRVADILNGFPVTCHSSTALMHLHFSVVTLYMTPVNQ